MASVNQKKLAQWVAKQIIIDREDGPCRRLVVRHLVAGKSGSIGEIVVVDRTDTETIADEIGTIIEDDARELGDRQTYSVRAFFGRSSKEEVGGKDRFTANVFHEGEAEDSLSSEPPNMRGMVAQQMRHNEAIMRTSTAAMGQMLDHMARINQTMANRLEKLEEGRFAQLETFEELLSKRHERELEATKLSNAEKRKEQVFEKLALLLPAVANKIVGKRVFPETIAGDMAELKTLLSSLTSEQIGKLGDILTPAQATAMLSVYEKFAADDKVETKTANGAIVKSSLDAYRKRFNRQGREGKSHEQGREEGPRPHRSRGNQGGSQGGSQGRTQGGTQGRTQGGSQDGSQGGVRARYRRDRAPARTDPRADS